jgi:hypothetical protein
MRMAERTGMKLRAPTSKPFTRIPALPPYFSEHVASCVPRQKADRPQEELRFDGIEVSAARSRRAQLVRQLIIRP